MSWKGPGVGLGMLEWMNEWIYYSYIVSENTLLCDKLYKLVASSDALITWLGLRGNWSGPTTGPFQML